MSNELALYEVQVGQETTYGTAVVATAILPAVEEGISMQKVLDGEVYSVQDGTLRPGTHGRIKKSHGEVSLPLIPTYEALPYILNMLFDAVTTPTGVGPYTWTYAAPVAAGDAPTTKALSVMYGLDGGTVFRATSCVVNELTLGAMVGDRMTLESDLLAYDVDDDGALIAASESAYNIIMGSEFALFIDDGGGTIGSTAVNTTAFGWELSLSTNRSPKWHLGALKPTDYREAKWNGTMKLMLEVNSSGLAELADILDATSDAADKLIRVKATRAAGLTFQVDVAGTAINAPELISDEDGVAMIEAEYELNYDSVFANFLAMEVVNGSASLT